MYHICTFYEPYISTIHACPNSFPMGEWLRISRNWNHHMVGTVYIIHKTYRHLKKNIINSPPYSKNHCLSVGHMGCSLQYVLLRPFCQGKPLSFRFGNRKMRSIVFSQWKILHSCVHCIWEGGVSWLRTNP